MFSESTCTSRGTGLSAKVATLMTILEKEKNENEREIDTLKNEYTKLKEEVENLRKAV